MAFPSWKRPRKWTLVPLVSAHQRAVAKGGELLLVIPASAAVRRVFELAGIDFLIPSFADLNQAMQQAHAALPAS
jgi:anti-anti-sigma regulatory factor